MPQMLFTNANLVLDRLTELQRGFNVLVSDGRIAAVSTGPIAAAGATVIDVGGRTLLPGLIDAHAHITGLSLTPKNIANPAADIAIASANYLRNCLMDGYTTIREAGDSGKPAVLGGEESVQGKALFAFARRVVSRVEEIKRATPESVIQIQ